MLGLHGVLFDGCLSGQFLAALSVWTIILYSVSCYTDVCVCRVGGGLVADKR